MHSYSIWPIVTIIMGFGSRQPPKKTANLSPKSPILGILTNSFYGVWGVKVCFFQLELKSPPFLCQWMPKSGGKSVEIKKFVLQKKILEVILSKPQPNLNTRLGLTIEWLCEPHHHPKETQCQQYLSCYWPDFDETLKVGSCEHLEQIPTVMVTFVHATFALATYVHIRNISAVTDPILMKLYR